MAGLVTLLRANSYDAIIVGAGVRLQANLTPLLEDIINTVRENAPRQNIGFNSSPKSTVDTIQRVLPLRSYRCHL